jgi:hypothetical protein
MIYLKHASQFGSLSLSSTTSCWFSFGVLYNILAHGLEAGLYPKVMKSPTLDEYSYEIIDGK